MACSVTIPLIWLVVQATWDRLLDRKVLDRGFPERLTSDQVFNVLIELRSTASRRDYLQGLLSRRVPIALPDQSPIVNSTFSNPPAVVKGVLDGDSGVAEDWAKLQEFWLGLSR